jgi:hypothetical protein
MKWMIVLALASLPACSKTEDKDSSKESLGDIKTEAAVDWAREQVADIDTRLASKDPGSASSNCAVIKPDMPAIKKADPKLAETLERKCGRDLAVRSMTVAVERAEADASECSSISVYEKMIAKAGADADPEVAKLRERVATACANK